MRRTVLSIMVASVALLGCGSDDSSDPSTSSDPGPVTVFAAASLTESFTAIGEAFEAANSDAEVTFNFAGSSDLVAQINEGAPADVYASANVANMDKLVDAENADGSPQMFATNASTIIVEAGNPTSITTIDDLTNDDLILVTCAPEVPCGSYATQIFENAGIEITPDSLEEDVKAVVTKVSLGEADAGIAYSTDVAAADGKIEAVAIPDDINVQADYPIAEVADAPHPDTAAAFIEFVLSDEAQEILAEFGFGPPK